jgi:lipooligosaccharide transport system permease protein
MPRWAHVLEHHALVYRRTWRGTVFTTFLAPALFLAAMGFGLGAFVDRGSPEALGGVTYLAFLAPGLLAAQAMQTAAFESTFPIMAGIVWLKTFGAMLFTPVRTRDLVVGQLAWMAVRLTLVSAAFLLVMVVFGAVTSALALLALPLAVLTGLAFAMPVAAFSATQRNVNKFNLLFRFGITPLFIFSGTFFPLSQLPDVVEPLAYVTPLYHGVALTRGVALGGIDPVIAVVHIAVLVGFVVAGCVASAWTFRRALVK